MKSLETPVWKWEKLIYGSVNGEKYKLALRSASKWQANELGGSFKHPTSAVNILSARLSDEGTLLKNCEIRSYCWEILFDL